MKPELVEFKDSLAPTVCQLFYTFEDPLTSCSDTVQTSIVVKPLPQYPIKIRRIELPISDSLLDLSAFLIKHGTGQWYGDGIIFNKTDQKYYFSNDEVKFIKGI